MPMRFIEFSAYAVKPAKLANGLLVPNLYEPTTKDPHSSDDLWIDIRGDSNNLRLFERCAKCPSRQLDIENQGAAVMYNPKNGRYLPGIHCRPNANSMRNCVP